MRISIGYTSKIMNIEKSQNEMAVEQLKLLGYPMVRIRKALHKLTGISQPEIARAAGVSRQGVTAAVNGLRGNRDLQERIAGIYQVPVDLIFPQGQ